MASAAEAPRLRVAQEANDAYERSRVGGLYFVVVWLLVCVTAGQHGLREWTVGAVFLLLAGARLAVRRLRRQRPDAHATHLAATLATMIATMAAWGIVTAFALTHPDYAATPTVVLFATSAFTTAFVHSYPMRRWPAFAGLTAGYGAPFVALLAARTGGAAAIAAGVFIHYTYLLIAARRARYEYHRALDLEDELRAQRDLFSSRSRIDGLTGLVNRREFNEQLAAELLHARASMLPLALMIIDVDHFKAINDRRGHAAGDHCLAALGARLLAACDGPDDVAARLGGEEFALLLPGTGREAAFERAQALRAALAAAPIDHPDGTIALTISVGVGVFVEAPHAGDDAFYREVDGALYRAKREGRNRVCTTAPPQPPER